MARGAGGSLAAVALGGNRTTVSGIRRQLEASYENEGCDNKEGIYHHC
jgi:hypothetical protein